jgi:hypothetical protein
MTEGTKFFVAAGIGFAVSLVGPVVAVTLGWGWLALSPGLVVLMAVSFAAVNEEDNPWTKGMLVGLAVALIVGAGACVVTFATFEPQ